MRTARPVLLPGAAVLLAALLLPGCATKRDLEITIDEVVALKRKQSDDYRAIQAELERRTQQIETGQTDLSASQSEFRSQAESISAELSRLGSALSDLEHQVDDLSRRVKELQNTQVIGLGSLSKRLDDTGARLESGLTAQGEKLDRFATEVSGQVDAGGKQLASLSKRDKQREKAVADLGKKLDALGKKLTAEVSAQQKQLAAGPGADPAELAALKKQVGFLGDTLPKEVDGQAKRLKGLEKELRDVASLLADLNGRLKALETR